MAKSLIWSSRALQDLDGICSYIARDSIYHAQYLAEQIFKIAESIPEFEMMGRIVPEFSTENLRERIYGNYRIVYLIQKTSIEIVTIHHSAMLLPEDI